MTHPATPIILQLRCPCCGIVFETLTTPWSVLDVQPASIWKREPCEACEQQLELEEQQHQARLNGGAGIGVFVPTAEERRTGRLGRNRFQQP